jgi:hypothetical protein
MTVAINAYPGQDGRKGIRSTIGVVGIAERKRQLGDKFVDCVVKMPLNVLK